MLERIKKEQTNVNDTCTDCGSFVDIGAVIDEFDTKIVMEFDLKTGMEEANSLSNKAKSRFPDTISEIKTTTDNVVLTLEFAVTVEKMLFQLENGLE